MSQCRYCNLTSTLLTCTELEIAYSFKGINAQHCLDCFVHYSPMGLSNGDRAYSWIFFMRTISLQERRAWRPSGSRYKQQSCLATAAIEDHWSDKKDPNKRQIYRHAGVSRPKGPDKPKVLRAIDLMRTPFILSCATKCGE